MSELDSFWTILDLFDHNWNNSVELLNSRIYHTDFKAYDMAYLRSVICIL